MNSEQMIIAASHASDNMTYMNINMTTVTIVVVFALLFVLVLIFGVELIFRYIATAIDEDEDE